MTLAFNPLPQTQFILGGPEKTRLLPGVFTTLKTPLTLLTLLTLVTSPGDIPPEEILTSYKTKRTLPCRLAEAVSMRALKAGRALKPGRGPMEGRRLLARGRH